MKAALLLLVLAGCEAIADGGVDLIWGGEHGDVFECEIPCAPGRNEWCWDGSEAELEQLKGDSCHSTNVFDDRLWPSLVGCAYGARGAGANATCGSFYPPESP